MKNLYKLLFEDTIPGNAPPDEQVHVFDFDDTLGLTQNANGVMVYRDGKPAFKEVTDLKSYLSSAYGVKDSDYLKPFIKKISNRDGAPAAYLSSAGLSRIQKMIPRDRQGATGQKTEPNAYVEDGEDRLLIDFTPSSGTDINTTEPIGKTIEKMKRANAQGSDTIVITARQASGAGRDFEGNEVEATNGEDMEKFLAKQGAKPTKGVLGVVGKNKGEEIIKKFVDDKEPPEEIHFYDDLKKNTDEVEDKVAQKVPSELHVYGPGEFAHGEADPEVPNKSYPEAEKEEKSMGEGKKKKKGLWANIHARRRKGLRPKRPGEKGYPKTLDIGEAVIRELVRKEIHQIFSLSTGLHEAGEMFAGRDLEGMKRAEIVNALETTLMDLEDLGCQPDTDAYAAAEDSLNFIEKFDPNRRKSKAGEIAAVVDMVVRLVRHCGVIDSVSRNVVADNLGHALLKYESE